MGRAFYHDPDLDLDPELDPELPPTPRLEWAGGSTRR